MVIGIWTFYQQPKEEGGYITELVIRASLISIFRQPFILFLREGHSAIVKILRINHPRLPFRGDLLLFRMKIFGLPLICVSASVLTLTAARFIEPYEKQVVINLSLDEPKFLIDIAGEQQWVTENEKWEIRRVCGVVLLSELSNLFIEWQLLYGYY